MNYQTLNELKDRYGIGRKAAASDLSPNAQVLAFRMKTAKQRRQERMLSQIELDSRAWSDWQDAYKTMQAEANYLYEKRKPLPGDLARGGGLVVQLSDVHFGALIPDGERRRGFSLAVAAKRLRLYAQQVLNFQLATGAQELTIALTGDLFDSRMGKERTDKLANSECSQQEAIAVGTDLTIAFIKELVESEAFGKVRICGVTGNEGRFTKDVTYGRTTAVENADTTLNQCLVRAFSGSDVELDFDPLTKVFEVQGERILLIHGHAPGFKHNSRQARGHVLERHRATFGICGHVHETMVDGSWARSASLCGTDDYADHGLQVGSRASQNLIHVLNGRLNVISLDLENPGDIEGYPMLDYRGVFG